jgi:hypothetical protein
LDNGNVLKITKDKEEFEMAIRIMNSKPTWAATIFSAIEKNGMYHIEKEFVKPIFPKESKTSSMNYGDARFEFTGRQWFDTENEADLINKISDILNVNIKNSNGRSTFDTAISCFNMCQQNDLGTEFNIVEFNPKSISKLIYKNKKERTLYEWFVVTFFKARAFGAFVNDLYTNIGINSNGDYCIFDVN